MTLLFTDSFAESLCEAQTLQQQYCGTGRSINKERMKDQYVVLRAMAFLMLHRGEFKDIPALQYRGDIDDFLIVYLMSGISQK